ncbi:hypothetical protein DPEC_G00238730 [Dallia pectoralis]|uniref:Uncharacterized protein n=1 Tax=Dallia pectoralis TaxID=75939 RepID=A0ACC2FYW2_DALPE|nr:hypothetical protein DPEC_G00238730 [Dallia pectoralis]
MRIATPRHLALFFFLTNSESFGSSKQASITECFGVEPIEVIGSSGEPDDNHQKSSSNHDNESITQSTLIHVRPREEIQSFACSDDIPVKSSIDKTVECLGVSEEPIEEICSSTETDHISLSSISECVSEISFPAEPQPNIALRPFMVGKQTPMLFTDQPSWLPERTNTQVEILRRIRENLAYMDLILGEWLEPQEEPEKSIGCFERATDSILAGEGDRSSLEHMLDPPWGP